MNEKEQFEADLKANEDASDKLDKELNAEEDKVESPFVKKSEISGDKKPSFLDNLRPTETVAPSSSTVSSTKVTFNEDVEVKKPHFPAWLVRKNEILREYDNLESNVPVNHPEYWNLRIPDGISRID